MFNKEIMNTDLYQLAFEDIMYLINPDIFSDIVLTLVVFYYLVFNAYTII